MNYFAHARIINSSLDDSFTTWLKVVFRVSPDADPKVYLYSSKLYWYNDSSSYAVASVAALLGLFNGTSYIPIALLFAFFCYSGTWALYRTFVNIYPTLYKPLAVAFLFIPSTFVWGSAIFKDTICMFSLGWMVFTTFRIFIDKDFSIKNIAILIISFYLLAIIKLYILLAFLPALSLWLLMNYSKKIASPGMRWLVNIFFISLTIGGFLFFSEQFAQELNKYSLEKIAKTATVTREWIGYVSDVEGGSGYDLGEIQPTLGGMLQKMPQAVVVTLFRPFPWEAHKAIIVLPALEALAFLVLTLKALFMRRRNLGILFKDPNLIFLLVFSVIFAFAVGISSYNFGALSRYKIPCMPFYGAMLAILLYKDQPEVDTKRKAIPHQRFQPAM